MVNEQPEPSPGGILEGTAPRDPGPRPLYNPAEEADRLRELERLGIAVDRPDDSLQELVRRVASLYGVGLCTVNLILEDRQIFKVWSGEIPPEMAETREVDRQHSLCSYVVASHIPLVIEDMQASEEWRQQYWHAVQNVRFYAGVPLVTSNGHALGTLCLADGQPRSVSAQELERLQYFSRRIAAELQLSGAMERTRALQEELETTARYSQALAELSVLLDDASANADESTATAALQILVDAAGLTWAGLVINQEDRAWAPYVAGTVPSSVQRLLRRRAQPERNAVWKLTSGDLPTFLGEPAAGDNHLAANHLACIALGTSDPAAPGVLLAARAADVPWAAQDRRFLESGARVLGASLRRFQRWQDLQTVSLTDGLTGLRNRRALEQLLADPGDLPRSCRVWVGDLHGFKPLNDSMGHAVGDLFLRHVADALRSQVRPRDARYLFRTGGDEITLILPTGAGTPADLGVRLQDAVARVATEEYPAVDLHLDLGEVEVPAEAPDLASALRLADLRMYEAKRARRTEKT